MPKWTILDKQTREHLGEVTVDTQKDALRYAQQEFGNDGKRYVEVTLHLQDRPPATRPPGFTLSQEEVELALLTWARAFKNVPEGFQVKVVVLANLRKPAMLAQVYDTQEKPEPGIDYDEVPEEQVEGFGPGEAPEGR
jgi:hypothetical protein